MNKVLIYKKKSQIQEKKVIDSQELSHKFTSKKSLPRKKLQICKNNVINKEKVIHLHDRVKDLQK